jgi:hypothetical protein
VGLPAETQSAKLKAPELYTAIKIPMPSKYFTNKSDVSLMQDSNARRWPSKSL